MEPHREEPQKALLPSAEQRPKRFRIVKLEERIAPSKGGNGTHNCPTAANCATAAGVTCPTYGATCYCGTYYPNCYW
jgi:hypothetical protein